MIEKQYELRRKQNFALSILVLALLIFITTIFLPPTFWVRLIKAGAEAAMVGGLADWFAVVALFRRPLGLPIPHTAIIPRSKDRIADNLAEFVREKFLRPDALAELIRSSDPAQRFTSWLNDSQNTRRLSRHTTNLVSGWLDLVDDRRIQAFIGDAVRTALGKMDLSQSMGSVLQMLTHGGRHQQLLDSAIERIIDLARQPMVRQQIAKRVVDWLKAEHSIAQMVLPTEWLGDKAAEVAGQSLEQFLQEVANNPKHELRDAFDRALTKLALSLKTDNTLRAKGEEIKSYIQNNPELANYGRDLWTSLREWLSQDLEQGQSQIQQHAEKMAQWFGEKLANDVELRDSLNDHMESLAQDAAPHFADFLTRHIGDTVRKWDGQDMSHQIELSIGPDLQRIRVSGTLVGFMIGLLLFLASNFSEITQLGAAL
ncbi:MAG TPA: DUF445 domain-containing protein [Burkholderiaceae bacterium]|nr:DUF445 domain-containing protein [Burkholderiaceae bacterium]